MSKKLVDIHDHLFKATDHLYNCYCNPEMCKNCVFGKNCFVSMLDGILNDLETAINSLKEII